MTTGVKRSFHQAFDRLADRDEPAKKTSQAPGELPIELWSLVLGNLPLQNLARVQVVCSLFRDAVSTPSFLQGQLDKTIPDFKVNFFGRNDWIMAFKRVGLPLSAGGILPINYLHAIFEVQKFVLSLKENNLSIEGDAGVTVMTFPPNLREALLDYLRSRNEEKFYVGCDPYMQLVMEEIPAKKSYTVIMTNSILNTTRDWMAVGHDNLLKKIQCDRPGVLEAAALVVMCYDRVSIPLFYEGNVSTGTRCKIEYEEMEPLTVGVYGDDDLPPFLDLATEPGPVSRNLRSPMLARGPNLGIAAARVLSEAKD